MVYFGGVAVFRFSAVIPFLEVLKVVLNLGKIFTLYSLCAIYELDWLEAYLVIPFA